jgi:hypothetical protein
MGDGKKRGLRSNLGVAMEFANAVLYSLSRHPKAITRSDEIVLPINDAVWYDVFDIEFPHKELLRNGRRIQKLVVYCHNYFNRGRNGIGYGKSGRPDFGRDRDVDRSMKRGGGMGKMGADIRGSDLALHPGDKPLLSPNEVINLAINYWNEFHRQKPQLTESVASRLQGEIDRLAEKLNAHGYFDPSPDSDERQRVLREIVQRYGQAEFRASLFHAYGRRCMVTACDATWAIEAAHILPYRGPRTNHVSNGVLLRCDIHTLFDLNLIGIHPDELTIEISDALARTCYCELSRRRLAIPSFSKVRPDTEALRRRWELFDSGSSRASQ